MGSYSRFEQYLTTLEVETCPEFWPASSVSGIATVQQGSANEEAIDAAARSIRALLNDSGGRNMARVLAGDTARSSGPLCNARMRAARDPHCSLLPALLSCRRDLLY